MENKEEEKLKAGFFASMKGGLGKSSYGLLPFVFIFLFLLAGGYFAVSTMRQSAHKLAGGENYNQLSANSAVYEGSASLPKDQNYFSSDEQPAPASADGKNPADRMKLGGKEAGLSEKSASASAAGAEQQEEAGTANGAPGFRQPGQTTMSSKLQSKGSGFISSGGQSSKTSVQGSVEAIEGGGKTTGTTAVQKNLQGAAPKNGGGHGVLESLKGAFRSSVYGARIASQDSAKNWISKTFDATPEATDTIHYDDNVKASLDTVNPNSIPKFLRDIDVSVASANTLTASKVETPSLDKAAEAKKEDSDADSPAKKIAQNATSGMLNSMFSGFSLSGSGGQTSATTDSGAGTGADATSRAAGGNNLSSGNSSADIVSVDDSGYVSYGDPKGNQVVFDSEGNLMGCTDNAAGISIPAGNPGCP